MTRPRFRLLLPVATGTIAGALMLVMYAEQMAHDARCDARRAEYAWERATGKIPPDAWRLDVECDVFVEAPPASSATILLGLVGLPGVLLAIPVLLVEGMLRGNGMRLFSLAWLAGIGLFWYRVGAWFDATLSDDPESPDPHFLLRFYFGCLRWLSPLVFVLVGISSLSHHHSNDILTMGVLMVWSGLGTFLLVRRFWSRDEGATESINQDPKP